MEPEEFKELARYLEGLLNERNITKEISNEAIVRTTIGRYYYYIFLKLRNEIIDAIDNTIDVYKKENPKYVVSLTQLKKAIEPVLPGTSKSSKTSVHQVIQLFLDEFADLTVADALYRLRWRRNFADYHLKTPIETKLRGEEITIKFQREELVMIRRDIAKIEKWLQEKRFPIHSALNSEEAPEKIESILKTK
ncbi:hypothetical protein, conserved [Thermococcus kodakarensis KOD1]|uniref:Uncharacterized protein n=1 Tax=Thermococcus kodakarensis (strain ATCC BAA-918 / JCM 12380 / KOD1) TaxID=69014 RepID=Q5JG84_THEKO|nr:hypothetical protein [Thermococcus kodakarensis]WCN28472.1 hypothetical protein POG15_02050 [Thermococcus kodakarensis]WCN30768.1 hypothetical protein POG21_02050 [Thermococcus kodakarensis]BAD84590.1 hypothetical protein, conserved [Thermococcus kodakarensis KOD1]